MDFSLLHMENRGKWEGKGDRVERNEGKIAGK
jgi:hypothetical protein